MRERKFRGLPKSAVYPVKTEEKLLETGIGYIPPEHPPLPVGR